MSYKLDSFKWSVYPYHWFISRMIHKDRLHKRNVDTKADFYGIFVERSFTFKFLNPNFRHDAKYKFTLRKCIIYIILLLDCIVICKSFIEILLVFASIRYISWILEERKICYKSWHRDSPRRQCIRSDYMKKWFLALRGFSPDEWITREDVHEDKIRGSFFAK